MIDRHLPYALIDDHPDSADLTVNIDDRGAARRQQQGEDER